MVRTVFFGQWYLFSDFPFHDVALRIEWLRTRARAYRFHEEVELLKEEQRRVLISLAQTAQWWEEKAEDVQFKPTQALREGASAYAARQAALRRALAASFRATWAGNAPKEIIDLTDGQDPENAGTLEFSYRTTGLDGESDDDGDDFEGNGLAAISALDGEENGIDG